MQRSSRLFSNTIVYGLGSALNRLLGVLFLPLFTIYLGPAEYGVVGLLTSTGALLLPLFSLGLSAAIGVCYFAERDTSGRENVLRAASTLSWLSALVLAGTGWLFRTQLSLLIFATPVYAQQVWVAFLGIAFNIAAVPWQLRLQFEERAFAFALATLGGVVGNIGTSVLLLELGLGSVGMLAGIALGQAVTLLIYLAYFGGAWAKPVTDFVRHAGQLLRQGIPLLPGFGFLFVLQNSVRWPLERGNGLTEVGVFSVGMTLGAAMSILTTAVVTAWLPYALDKGEDWERGRRDVATNFQRYFGVGATLVVLFAVGAQPMVALFAAHQFFEAWRIVGFAALMQFLMSIYSLQQVPLYLEKKVHWNLLPQGAAALLVLLLSPLVLRYGSGGAVAVMLAGHLLLLLAGQLAVIRKVCSIKSVPYDYLAMARMTLVLMVAIGASMALPRGEWGQFFAGGVLIAAAASALIAREIPRGGGVVFMLRRQLGWRRGV